MRELEMPYRGDVIDARIIHSMGLYETAEIKYLWYKKGAILKEFLDIQNLVEWEWKLRLENYTCND